VGLRREDVQKRERERDRKGRTLLGKSSKHKQKRQQKRQQKQKR
jgi:hypothetical protein